MELSFDHARFMIAVVGSTCSVRPRASGCQVVSGGRVCDATLRECAYDDNLAIPALFFGRRVSSASNFTLLRLPIMSLVRSRES